VLTLIIESAQAKDNPLKKLKILKSVTGVPKKMTVNAKLHLHFYTMFITNFHMNTSTTVYCSVIYSL